MIALVMLFFLTLTAPIASATEQLFRCDDGTVTNRPERLCAPYEPHGTVMVAPEGSRPSTFAPFFEPHRSAPPPLVAGQTALPTAAPDVCALYQEWAALNLQTGGGVTFRNTQEVPRWLSLSRMFTAIGRPQCE
jgi:hypothetical protein